MSLRAFVESIVDATGPYQYLNGTSVVADAYAALNNNKGDTMRITILQQQNPEGNRPHFKGFITLDGKEYEFGAWPSKSGKAGVFSGTLKPKTAKEAPVETEVPF